MINLNTVTTYLTLTAFAVHPLMAAELRCPPMLPAAHPGFEQVGPAPTAHWQLHGMRLFDGPPGEEKQSSPAELAPDKTAGQRNGFTSTWRFAGDEDLLLVCTYSGSGTYFRARIRPLPTQCTLQNLDGLTLAWCERP